MSRGHPSSGTKAKRSGCAVLCRRGCSNTQSTSPRAPPDALVPARLTRWPQRIRSSIASQFHPTWRRCWNRSMRPEHERQYHAGPGTSHARPHSRCCADAPVLAGTRGARLLSRAGLARRPLPRPLDVSAMECSVGIIYEAPSVAGESALERITDFGSPVFQVKNRAQRYVRRDGICLGYRVNAEVVSYAWTNVGPCKVPLWRGVEFQVPPACVYVWDCRTHEPFRRQGFFDHILTDLRRHAAPHLLLIACENGAPSQRAIARQFTPAQAYRLERLWRFHRVNGRFGRTLSISR